MRPLGLALAALFLLPAVAHGQWTLTLRQGKAWVESSDLRVQRPDGTDVTLHDVTWEDRSYRSPIYYELGLTWWSPSHPGWGLGLDLTHAKAILDTHNAAFAEGRIAGAPVAGPVPVRDVVPALQFSHGLNFLTANGYRRWWTGSFSGRSPGVSIYIGLGAGVVIPHVEAQAGGVRTDGYQLAGPAARAVAGLDVPFDEHISLVGEATLSWADVDAGLTGGGRVESTMVLPQLSLGLALRD